MGVNKLCSNKQKTECQCWVESAIGVSFQFVYACSELATSLRKLSGRSTDFALNMHVSGWHWPVDFALSHALPVCAGVKLELPGARIWHKIHFHVFVSDITQPCCPPVTG